jgi:hypothetical protein
LQTPKIFWPFLESHDEKQVLDYYQITKEPMDFGGDRLQRDIINGF